MCRRIRRTVWIPGAVLVALLAAIGLLRWGAAGAPGTVEAAPGSALLSESFDSWPPAGWVNWKEVGIRWTHSTNGYFSPPGAAKLEASPNQLGIESAWLISPKINVPVGAPAVLTYTYRFDVGSDNVGWFAVLVSTNYTGSGDPNGVTWRTLTETNVPASPSAPKVTPWMTATLPITEGVPFYVAFYGQVPMTSTFYVDDVSVTPSVNPVSVGDFVWHDLDGDGIQDPGEPGIPGVTVTLRNAATNQQVAQTVTLTDGRYTLTNVAPLKTITYVMTFEPPPAYYPTRFRAQAPGSSPAVDSDVRGKSTQYPSNPVETPPFTVTRSVTDIDAGFVIPPVVTGQVWYDADFDGLRDAGEGPMSQITVSLWSLSPTTTLLGETVPDAGGRYTLTVPNDQVGTALQAKFTPWDAFATFSPPNQGNDEGRDSDVVEPGVADVPTLLSGQRTRIDAGVYPSRRVTITPSAGGTLVTSLGITVTVGPQSVTTDTVIVFTPVFTQPGILHGRLRTTGRAFELRAFRASDGSPVAQLNKPYTVTLQYTDAEWQNAHIRAENTLNLYLKDNNTLQPCQGCSLDAQANRLVAAQQKIGTAFLLMGEALSEVRVNDVRVVEGNRGNTTAQVMLRLVPTSTQTVTVTYATQDGTATAGQDYQSLSGTITFAPGTAQKPLTLTVLGDAAHEPDETFTVTLSAPVNAFIVDAQAVVTIVNDDAATGTATPSGGGTITTTHGVTITFPPGSVTSTVTISFTSYVTPGYDTGTFRYAGKSFRIIARDANGKPVTKFSKPFTITVHYRDEDWQKAGISPESSLNLTWWNGSQWVKLLPCPGCSLDTQRNIITVVLDHLTRFALMGEAPSDRKLYLPVVVKQ